MKMHNVFKNDPIELKKKIHKQVQIRTMDNKIFEGIIYTIDPVSESICLLGKDNSLNIIFPHGIQSTNIIKDMEEITPCFENKNEEKDCENIEELKNKVKNWLMKHMIPVEVNGDTINIGDQLFITPPYKESNCVSANEVTLFKIQSLIRKMYSCENS